MNLPLISRGVLILFIALLAAGVIPQTAAAQPIAAAPGDPPLILDQPIGRVASAGGHVALSVAVDGTSLHYQWFKDGQLLANDTNIFGATTNVLNIDPAGTNLSGAYSVIITNTAGASTSKVASITVNQIQVNGTVQGNTGLLMRILGPRGDVYRIETGPFGPPWSTNGYATNYTGEARYLFLFATGQGSIRVLFDHMLPILYSDFPNPVGPPGSVNLRAYGKLNQVWRFQGTTNFVQWDDIVTGTNTTGWLKFDDGFPKPPYRFFRIAPE